MRKIDLEKIVEAYSGEKKAVIGGPFSRGLGISSEPILNLYTSILEDLDQNNYGISWWQSYEPSLSWKRRILISDHLLKCISSIEDNLIEGHIHFLEAKDFWEKYSKFFEDSIKHSPDKGFIPNFPPPDVISDMNLNLRDTHISGFFRAAGSVADCLAGAIIGIMGIPKDLKKADLETTREFLKNSKKITSIQKEFGQWFEMQIANAGPQDWLSWTMKYRNMLVHRARRLQIDSIIPKPVLGTNNRPLVDHLDKLIIKSKIVFHLAKNPEVSDIEAFIHNNTKSLLEESAETTMNGILKSLETLINSTLVKLLDTWKQRKANPSLIPQPINQWPKAPTPLIEHFVGYEPGSLPVNTKQMFSSIELIARMKAASLAGSDIEKWSSIEDN